jgi:hypothetical protein
MARTLKYIAAATALFFATAAFAETNGDLPPDCPGGGTATGKITCTGPLFNRTCTEGPPWVCTLKDDKVATLEVGDTPRPPKRVIDLLPPTSLSDGGSAPPTGGGGGGGGGSRGPLDNVGSMTTVMTQGSSGPSFL